MTTPGYLNCDYASLVNDLGYHLFGLRPTATDVISENVASTAQAADIQRCLDKGLAFVYAAYRWSFLRPVVPLTTHAPYTTGTIAVDVNGNVTGSGTTFPSYSASASGWMTIPAVGSYAVQTYTSGVALVLANYTGGVVAAKTTFSLGFNAYPLPTGVDSFEGELTYPQGTTSARESLLHISEVEIRRMLIWHNQVGKPRYYALTTNTFDPTAGSSRFVSLYPVPDAQYILSAVGTLRPTKIDATNKYPIGIEVLAPCLAESCLAAAEREIEQKDAGHPDAVHNRALEPLLAMAIQTDKDRGSPETLGVDHGHSPRHRHQQVQPNGIYWDGGGGITGYI